MQPPHPRALQYDLCIISYFSNVNMPSICPLYLTHAKYINILHHNLLQLSLFCDVLVLYYFISSLTWIYAKYKFSMFVIRYEESMGEGTIGKGTNIKKCIWRRFRGLTLKVMKYSRIFTHS